MRATDDPDRILRYAHFPHGFGQKRLRLRGGGAFFGKGDRLFWQSDGSIARAGDLPSVRNTVRGKTA